MLESKFIFLLPMFLMTIGEFAFANTEVKCSEGLYRVRSHPRRAYYKTDGTYVSATRVAGSCREKRKGHDFWNQKLKEGHPRDWTKKEKSIKWAEEERERVLEALSDLPEILWPKSLDGIYRMSKSKDYPNPASHGGAFVVLYDTAFEKKHRLARILAHELAHQNYEELSLTFNAAKAMLNKYKNRDQVKNSLGEPSGVLLKGKQELWNYDEPGTGYQRLTFTFDEMKKLEAVFWIPRSGEPESELEKVFSHYPESRFQTVRTQEVSPPHSLNTETIYSDEKSTAIWYNDYAKRVEGINWYLDDRRSPADSENKN